MRKKPASSLRKLRDLGVLGREMTESFDLQPLQPNRIIRRERGASQAGRIRHPTCLTDSLASRAVGARCLFIQRGLELASNHTPKGKVQLMNRLLTKSGMQFTVAVALLLSLTPGAPGYSILTHEAIIDTTWDTGIKPLLTSRFGTATPEQLRKAHAYAYGGAIIQDMGYYPFGSK